MFNKKRKRYMLFIFGALLFALCPFVFAALPPEQLHNAIQEKTKELQHIQEQLQETQKNLGETQEKSHSLKQELNKINTNVKQLDLGIKKNKTTIEKLSLEINGLENEIGQTEVAIQSKQGAITNIMQEIQGLDDENGLIAFLKHETLTGGIEEQSRLNDLGSDLADTVLELKNLNTARTNKLDEKGQKKKGIETESKTLQVRKSLKVEEAKDRAELLEKTKSQEKIYAQMVTDLAKKQAEIAAEIEAIDAALRNKINEGGLPQGGKGVLGMPVTDARMTQEYGATDFAVRGGYRGKWHNGVDFGGAIGTPIIAAEAGTVLATGNQDLYCKKGAYGKFVVIKHPNNLVTLYGHLSQINAQIGNLVQKGTIIGYMGKTGYAFGAHLHFTVFDGSTFGMRGSRVCGPMPSGGDVDPRKYL